MAEITQIDLGLVVGDTGATGATGPTGPQGPSATVSVGSVTTTTYGNPAQVTNSGTATDAVFDFVIPQGAPGEEVTDVSSLTLDSITETAASFPVPAVGDVMSVVMGKVKKFFADTVAALNTKLNKANVVNDLTYTTSGYALDARAGKSLKTQLDSLNDSLPNLTVKRLSVTAVQNNARKAGFGFVYDGGKKLFLLIPLTINNNVSSINITKLLLSFREPSGGFVIADNADVTSYIAAAGVSAQGIDVTLSKPDGLSVATNVPVCGQASITCTFT